MRLRDKQEARVPVERRDDRDWDSSWDAWDSREDSAIRSRDRWTVSWGTSWPSTYSAAQLPALPTKMPRRRRRATLIIVLAALMCAFAAPAFALWHLVTQATNGVHQLQAAQSLVARDGARMLSSPTDFATLRNELMTAHNDFADIQGAVDLGQFGIQISPSLSDDARLVSMAVHLTAAGVNLLDAMQVIAPLLSQPFAATDTTALTIADFIQAQGHFHFAISEIQAAAGLAAAVNPSNIPSSFGSKVSTLITQLPHYSDLATQYMQLFDTLPQLLGVASPSSYLIMAMDRTELRTVGGFIGNYGVLTISGGHVGKMYLQDTYQLDAAYFAKTHLQVPASYPWWPYRNGSPLYGWGLRDSGLSPDFPTNAATALGIVQSVNTLPQFATAGHLTGTIAMTSQVMQQIIAIGGGTMILPEFPNHTLTPANLEDTIHCFLLGACRNETAILQPGDATTNDHKRFSAYLGQGLLDRVRHFDSAAMKQLVDNVVHDIATKDLQIYLSPNQAENALVGLHAAGNVPLSSGDSLFVTDTNVGGNKANAYVTQSEVDVVTLLPDGDALHHLLVRTDYQRQGPLYEGTTGQTAYWEYRRIYMPAQANYLGLTGALGGVGHSVNLDQHSDLAGHTMVGASLAIGDGSALADCHPTSASANAPLWNCSEQITDTYLAWDTPHAWAMVAGKPVYQLQVMRQPGTTVHLTVLVDASHRDDRSGAVALLTRAVQNYDQPAKPNTTPRTNAAWQELTAHATTIFDGALAQDESLTWPTA